MSANPETTARVRLTVEELTIDAIAIKAAQGHPDHPVTGDEVDCLLAEIKRLRAQLRSPVDHTAQSGPITRGQKLVAFYELGIQEPHELAQAIDRAILEAANGKA